MAFLRNGGQSGAMSDDRHRPSQDYFALSWQRRANLDKKNPTTRLGSHLWQVALMPALHVENSFCSTGSCLGSLLCAAPCRRVRLKRSQKVSGGDRYPVDGCEKCSFVDLRWLVEAANFSHELQCSRAYLFVCHRRFEVE